MKKKLLINIFCIVFFLSAHIHAEHQKELVSYNDELPFFYFGEDICSFLHDLNYIRSPIAQENFYSKYLTEFYEDIDRGETKAPLHFIEHCLFEALEFLRSTQTLSLEESTRLLNNIEHYCKNIETILDRLGFPDTAITRSSHCKTLCSLNVKDLIACCLNVRRDLTVNGNVIVDGSVSVRGTFTSTTTIFTNELIGQPQQACIIFVDNTFAEKARICSSPIPGDKGLFISVDMGVTQNLRVNNEGGTVIAEPTSGFALDVNGDLNVTGDIILPQAGNSGQLKLGGTGSTNVIVYEFGTRNFFVDTSTPNTGVTGADNVSMGTNANSNLTTGNNTIAIGNTARARADDSVTISNGTNTNTARTIGIGSRDSTSTGAAPSITGINAIGIGSAMSTNAGAVSSGLSSIALGPADGATFAAARATGARAIAIGVNARGTNTLAISLGSASGTAGGEGPEANQINSIAIGSANATMRGALANTDNGIAIGSADAAGTFDGAVAGTRSVAMGVNPTANAGLVVLIGSASGTAGGSGPSAVERCAIGIGSANGTLAAPNSGNISTIAIGGSDGVFAAPSIRSPRAIGIGLNARTSATGQNGSVALGSASGTAGGSGPNLGAATAIAIGSASGASAGANATGAGAIAIGSASASAIGASATAARSVAIGNGASTSQTDAIVLGNAVVTDVRVGVGIAAPGAKVDIVGADGTIVLRFNQVNTAIGNAPRWLNPSTSAVAGTPIHYNAANQLFGFTSSKRYKTNIRPIDNESEILYQLNPVLYDPKEGYGEGSNIPGFIAEEVYDVAPNLAILNSNAEPENISYNSLHAFIIKEIQKHQKKLMQHKIVLNKHSHILFELLRMIKNPKKIKKVKTAK